MALIYTISDEEEGEPETWSQRIWSVIPVLTVLGTSAMKIILQIQYQNLMYSEMITKALYQKSLNSDCGVLAHLLETCVQQEFKESLVAYFFLWQSGSLVGGPRYGEPLVILLTKLALSCVFFVQTESKLDGLCENFFQSIGDDVDFEVGDSFACNLSRLLQPSLRFMGTFSL
eukprot:m.326448 g.326448  ORF g.326448 m.326448 type:complete len:173 (+) comp55573_c0_seq19:418-936(+)